MRAVHKSRRRHFARHEFTPAVTVDWSQPAYHVTHAVRLRGAQFGADFKTAKVPVFKGCDAYIVKRLWQEKKRHEAGRWAGSRFQSRNTYDGDNA